jgi:ubiquitin-protein ligase
MRRVNKRIPKEIENGFKSKLFRFFYDEKGVLGEELACYVLFKPEDGPYKNQEHILQIKWRYGSNTVYEYPDDPPHISFITPIMHSNIGVTGAICLDILKKGSEENGCKYSPMYGIEAFYNSIIGLLICPTPSSPLNGEAARCYNENKNNPEYYSILDGYYHARIHSFAKFFDTIRDATR